MKLVKSILDKLILVAAIAAIALTGLSFANVITPLIVISGSMEPTIMTGSLIVAKQTEAADLKVGDVAAFPRSDGVLVTHRITSIEPYEDSKSSMSFRMKGDANEEEDQDPYVQSSAYTPVVTVPHLGNVFAFIQNNRYALIAVACFGFGLYLLARMGIALVKSRKEEKSEITSDDTNDSTVSDISEEDKQGDS